VASILPAQSSQAQGWPGSLFQRPDHRTGEKVRQPEIPVSGGEKETG